MFLVEHPTNSFWNINCSLCKFSVHQQETINLMTISANTSCSYSIQPIADNSLIKRKGEREDDVGVFYCVKSVSAQSLILAADTIVANVWNREIPLCICWSLWSICRRNFTLNKLLIRLLKNNKEVLPFCCRSWITCREQGGAWVPDRAINWNK